MHNRPLLIAEEIGGVLVVAFQHANQSIDELLIPQVNDELLSKTQSATKVVLNMQNVSFFGSAFIETMFLVWKRVKSNNGAFAVCCLQPHCREVLEVTNLIGLWGGYDTQAEAIAVATVDDA